MSTTLEAPYTIKMEHWPDKTFRAVLRLRNTNRKSLSLASNWCESTLLVRDFSRSGTLDLLEPSRVEKSREDEKVCQKLLRPKIWNELWSAYEKADGTKHALIETNLRLQLQILRAGMVIVVCPFDDAELYSVLLDPADENIARKWVEDKMRRIEGWQATIYTNAETASAMRKQLESEFLDMADCHTKIPPLGLAPIFDPEKPGRLIYHNEADWDTEDE